MPTNGVKFMMVVLMHGEWVYDLKTDLNIINNVQLRKGERQAGLGRRCLILVRGTACGDSMWPKSMWQRQDRFPALLFDSYIQILGYLLWSDNLIIWKYRFTCGAQPCVLCHKRLALHLICGFFYLIFQTYQGLSSCTRTTKKKLAIAGWNDIFQEINCICMICKRSWEWALPEEWI